MNMSESAGISHLPLSVVPVEGMTTQRLTHWSYISFPLYYPDQTESFIQVRDEDIKSMHFPRYLQNITSLNASRFVDYYMNEIGWLQNGTFVTLLSTMGYHFYEINGRVISRKDHFRVAPALSVLISELWVTSAVLPYFVTPLNFRIQIALWYPIDKPTSSTSNGDMGMYHRPNQLWVSISRRDGNTLRMHTCVPIMAHSCKAAPLQRVFDSGRPYTEASDYTQKQF